MTVRLYWYLVLPFCLLYALPAWAQHPADEQYEQMEDNLYAIVRFAPELAGSNQALIETGFDAHSLLNSKPLEALKGLVIQRVELVYTAYRESNQFAQEALNRDRMHALYTLAPELFENNLTEWRLVEQSGANSGLQGREFFHGFVITFQPKATRESMRQEIAHLRSVLRGDAPVSDPFAVGDPYLETPSEEEKAWEEFEKTSGIEEAKPETETDPFSDTAYVEYAPNPANGRIIEIKSRRLPKRGFSYSKVPFKDTVINKVMKRNKHWKDLIVVTDVTGSMSPYSSQILLWHKLSFKQEIAKRFVFFNDGDQKPTAAKRLGATGGVYIVDAKSFKEVENTAIQAMMGGGGGDCPENNLEATIKGLKNCKNCGDIVMIADNWATPRDLELVRKLDKPVKVILCGIYWGANVEYLNLARETGGSIHTIDQDLDGLIDLNEGEEIRLGGQIFRVTNGRLEEIGKM